MVVGRSIRGNIQTVVVDEGIAITNAHSGRRLYAQKNKSWEKGVGAGTGTYYADQKWHFVESMCPTQYGIATAEDTCYEITNAHSGRRLYAQDSKDAESGVGGGVGKVYDDQKWMLQENDCGVSDDRCFLIVNARSGRRLYAQSGKNWESGVGASVGAVYDEQKWYIDIILAGDLVKPCLELGISDLGSDCEAESIESSIREYLDAADCPHGFEDEIKAWTQELNYGEALLELRNSCKGLQAPCLTGWHDFTIQGCTYQKIVDNVEKYIPNCDHDAETELQYWTSAQTKQESRDKIDLICGQGWDTVPQSAFTDINTDFENDFMNEYVDGRTYLNTETGSFQDTEVGKAIKSFRKSEATSSVLQSVPDLETCELQSIMCCFGRDRQPNDNNGNCAEPLDSNCVNADPMDNSNLCFLDTTEDEFGSFSVYPGETEGDVHCHGLAWAEDINDFTSQLRYNNFFFVSLFDHMYQRGYVESMLDSRSPHDIPMCACIEHMPPVSRADCTQIDAKLHFTVSLDKNHGQLIAMPDDINALEVEFNSCHGTNPSNGNKQNNDLASYVHKLHNKGKLSKETQDAIFDVLVGHDQPNNDNAETPCVAAYEEATGHSYPEGIAITNAHSGRKLYAEEGQRFEAGFGASNSADFTTNQKWYFVKSSCDGGAYVPVGGADCYEILNAASDRRIYAQARRTWEQGVGASSNYVYPDQKWTLEETDYNGKRAYFLVNADSGRRLYAQAGKTGESGVGSGVGTKYADQKWFIDFENNYA